MSINNTSIKSTGGIQLHCIYSPPEGEIKGLVQIVHGMAEYAERYKPFIEFLNQHGYFVFGHDHFGHGQTAPTTVDLGYIPMDGGVDMLIDDTIAVANKFKKDHPDKQLYLMGHSMGSFISRCVLAKAGEMYTAAVLSGTGYAVTGASFGLSFVGHKATSKGEKTYSDLAYNLVFGQYNKKQPNVHHMTGFVAMKVWLMNI